MNINLVIAVTSDWENADFKDGEQLGGSALPESRQEDNNARLMASGSF